VNIFLLSCYLFIKVYADIVLIFIGIGREVDIGAEIMYEDPVGFVVVIVLLVFYFLFLYITSSISSSPSLPPSLLFS